jgi:hypothetical protein
MAARRAHAARTVLLLRFGQLLAPSRRFWAAHAPDGFTPRFETTLSWAARFGFAPGPLDLCFERALDLLTARSLLERTGLGAQAGVLAPRLLELAWQLAPLGAALVPERRGAWAQSAIAAGSLNLDHPHMALEVALARIAIEWVATSAHVTDRLLLKEAGALDLLVVLEGLQPDPVARALAANARAAAERAKGRQAADVRDEGAQPADKDLVQGCMHLYYTMEAVVQHVTPHLAGMFVFRLLEIADHLPPGFVQRIPVLSRDAEVATNIRRAWQAGAYQRALATYLKAQIWEELHPRVPQRARL